MTYDTHASTIDKLLHCYKLLTATATSYYTGRRLEEGWKKVGEGWKKVGEGWRRLEEVGRRLEECWKKVE